MKTTKTSFSLQVGACLLLGVALLTGTANAQSEFLTGTDYQPNIGWVGNIGYEFQTGSTALTVDDLGVLAGPSGLTESHEVGIWEVESTGDVLVGSATVGAGGTNTGPTDFFSTASETGSDSTSVVYETVTTPFNLTANTDYVIGAYFADGTDFSTYIPGDYTYNSSIGTVLGYAGPSGSSFAEPTISGSNTTVLLGPDFIASPETVTDIPEPSALALVGVGLLAFVFNQRRLTARQS